MTTGSLDALRAALESTYGLALAALSGEQLESSARTAGTSSPGDAAGLARVVDHLPIEESWLFRDDDLWRWLRDDLVPPKLADTWRRGVKLRAASLGCSTGQEPFSLAILLQGLLEAWGVPASAAHEWAEVVGFDCSPARIAAARCGELSSWSVERCSPEWPRTSLVPLEGGRHRVDARVRAMCRFEVANILELAGGPWLTGFDLVLCRHALIYFQPQRAAEVVVRLAGSLDTGSVLVLGTPEAHLLQGAPGLQPLGHLGAARVRGSPPAPTSEARSKRSRPRRTVSATRALATASLPPVEAARPMEKRSWEADGEGEAHLRAALAHAASGRPTQALEEARAACFLHPDDLLAQLVLARLLAAVDGERGRATLRGLLETVAALPPGAGLISAPELSVDQVARAARLLLQSKEER